jgi:hypothetical protein
MSDLTIRAGTLVRTSEIGYNNFLYPSSTYVEIKKTTRASVLSWVGSLDHCPLRVSKASIWENQPENEDVVVWIMNELLRKAKTN